MFKFAAIVIAALCLVAVTSAAPGLVETHHVVHQPVLAKVGSIVHSAPSAVSHQSITQVHSKAVVQPVLAPVLKSTVLHASPVTHHTYAAAPVVHTVPIVHSAPLVHSVIHSAPVVQAVHAPHLAYSLQQHH